MKNCNKCHGRGCEDTPIPLTRFEYNEDTNSMCLSMPNVTICKLITEWKEKIRKIYKKK